MWKIILSKNYIVIKQIIVESGMKDVVAMQRLFRENENMSTEEYRMEWAQWVK